MCGLSIESKCLVSLYGGKEMARDPALRQLFALHLVNAWDFGVIDNRVIDRVLRVADSYAAGAPVTPDAQGAPRGGLAGVAGAAPKAPGAQGPAKALGDPKASRAPGAGAEGAAGAGAQGAAGAAAEGVEGADGKEGAPKAVTQRPLLTFDRYLH